METDSLLWLPLPDHKTLPNRRRQQSKKKKKKSFGNGASLYSSYIWISNTSSFPLLCNSTFKVVWVYAFALACPRGQLWNSEPSLEFGQWIFVKFEGAHSGIFRDSVYASCISLYVLPFRAISQMAPLCNVHLVQKKQTSPLPGMEIYIFSFWDHPCYGTVPLCSHATFGKCISTAKLM